MPDLLSPVRAPTAWDCSDSGQGEIPASYAGSGDTRGCSSLLEGTAMAVICAPLRASGETLGSGYPDRTTTASRHRSPYEGVVLYARGVLGSRFEEVGCLVVGLSCFSGRRV